MFFIRLALIALKAVMFLESFTRFSTESIKNEFYTDLITCLKDDIHVEGTTAHFVYANKMGI